jgi:hypothetical protein
MRFEVLFFTELLDDGAIAFAVHGHATLRAS